MPDPSDCERNGLAIRFSLTVHFSPGLNPPAVLSKWSDAQEQLLGRLRDDHPDAEASARYNFLHESHEWILFGGSNPLS